MNNFDEKYFMNQVQNWDNEYLIIESTVNINGYSEIAKRIILLEIKNRNIDLNNASSPLPINSDKYVIFEGNAYEATLINKHLQSSNIITYTNGDFYGDFNHNNIAQIAVDLSNEIHAKKLVNAYIESNINVVSVNLENNDLIFNKNKKIDSSIYPYNIEIWKFIILLVIAPYVYLSYYIYKQWKYMNNHSSSGFKISPVFPAILQNLAFFKLYNFIYLKNNKYDELHKFLSYLLPLISILFSILSFKLPQKYSFVGIFSILALIPFVYEMNRNTDCIKRKFISFAEIIIIFIGILLYIVLFAKYL